MICKILAASILAAVSVVATSAHAQEGPSAIHGFGILNIQNDYITPRGLMVTNKAVAVHLE
jgi:hypothetical protein